MPDVTRYLAHYAAAVVLVAAVSACKPEAERASSVPAPTNTEAPLAARETQPGDAAPLGPDEVPKAILQRQRFDALDVLDQTAFEAAWKTDLEIADKPAGQALADLLGELGMELYPGEHREALARPVTLRLAGVSFIEAVEHISAAAGLHPVYPNLWVMNSLRSRTGALPPANVVRFETGPRPWPVTFVGPFMIRVANLKENVPHATGSVRLVSESLGIPKPIHTLMDGYSPFFEIRRIADAEGRVLNAVENLAYTTRPQITGVYSYETVTVDLKNLLRRVEWIESLRGSVRLELPTRVTEFVLDSVEEGAMAEADGLGVVIQRVSNPQLQHIAIKVTGLEPSDTNWIVRMAPSSAEGEPLEVITQHALMQGRGIRANDPKRATIGVSTKGQPASLAMKIVRSSETVAYPFELKRLPLSHFREMPEKLAELEFGDHSAPVAIEFVRFLRRGAIPQVELKLVNHANKAVARIESRFVYLDVSGTRLEDRTHTQNRPGNTMLVETRSEALISTPAFFMPDKTETIRVEVQSAVFADGSEWRSE